MYDAVRRRARNQCRYYSNYHELARLIREDIANEQITASTVLINK
jgi:hypothetical protein